MFGVIHGVTESLPESCSPETVRQFSGFPVFLDTKRFPISQELITSMGDYMDMINQILNSGGVRSLSLQELIQLQGLLIEIQSCDPSEMQSRFMEFDEEYRDLALWLHFYLELRESVHTVGVSWKDVFSARTTHILNNTQSL